MAISVFWKVPGVNFKLGGSFLPKYLVLYPSTTVWSNTSQLQHDPLSIHPICGDGPYICGHWIQPFCTIEYSNLLCNMCPKFGSVPSLWISNDKLPHFWSNSKLLSHYCRVTDNKANLFLRMFLTAMTLNCAWNCQFAGDPQEEIQVNVLKYRIPRQRQRRIEFYQSRPEQERWAYLK